MMINSPLIVGYKGEVGSFILNGFLKSMSKASDIWCVDVNDSVAEVELRILRSDYIFLCIPLNKTIEWIGSWKHLLKNKVIIEQCSIKTNLYKGGSLDNLNTISMHLLFKPSGTSNLKDRFCHFFANKGYSDIKYDDLKGFAHEMEHILNVQSVIGINNYEEHDKNMALEQALVHRVILVLDEMLEQGKPRTYIGLRVKELADRIKSGDIELYKSIQSNKWLKFDLNKFGTEMDNFAIEDYMEKENE